MENEKGCHEGKSSDVGSSGVGVEAEREDCQSLRKVSATAGNIRFDATGAKAVQRLRDEGNDAACA